MPKLLALIFFAFISASNIFSQELEKVLQQTHLLQQNHPAAFHQSLQNKPPLFKGINNVHAERKISSLRPQNLSGQCYDTSVRLLYKNDTVNTSTGFITFLKDGNILSPGAEGHFLNNDYSVNPFVLKCTPQGDTIWLKKIKLGYKNMFNDVYYAHELADNSIILTGDMQVPVPYNGKSILLIIKLSPQGNLIWEKTYESKYWDIDTTTGQIYISDCKEDANGDLYFCGNIQYWDSQPRAAIVMKTDKNGNPIWSKGYTVGSRPYFAGMQIKNNNLQLLGHTYLSYQGQVIFGLSLNKTTGDSIYTKAWQMPYNSTESYNAYAYIDKLTLSNNGNYLVYGNTLGDFYSFDSTKPYVHQCVLEFTPDLEYVNSTLFKSWQQSNGGNSRITVLPDGSGAFSRLQYVSGYSANILFGSFINNQIVKERVIQYRGRANLWVSNFLSLGNGGQFAMQNTVDSVKDIGMIEIDKLHNSDTSQYCLGLDSSITQITPGISYFQTSYFPYDSIKSKILTVTNRPFQGVEDATTDIISGCEAVSFCNKIKLSASDDTLCVSTPLFITVEKNKECGSYPFWQYDSSVVKSFTAVNDSTVKIIFKTSWQGKIFASVDGCSGLISDSVFITVLQAPAILNLGNDTVICLGNTITLNAKSGYASYKWQDGSSDSTFIVTKPGIYFVETTNACDGIYFYDTVTVSSHPPIPLNIGADTSICDGDTLVIKAPAGFINYNWSPADNINSTVSQLVKVYPPTTTQYNLTAEKTPGCFAYDTIKIIVNSKPAVYIGNDTSFCKRDTLTLDAGEGFADYLWNTGEKNEHIKAAGAGNYFVTVTAQNGCSGSDTINVKNVFANPVVSLTNDSILCSGNTYMLDAGAGFSSYLWQDASIKQTFNVLSAGVYYVQVTDANGCVGSDTTLITKIAALPSGFLISNAEKCSYDTLVLQSNQSYASYLWSTGSTERSIKIISTGSYWLMITDSNNCSQKEYTIVSEKKCYNTIYFPSAFTPNGDGLNDIFRPAVFGSLQQFRMLIYNRWGTKIFETSDPQKGWNGMINGVLQNNDSYIWTASYQLKGLQPVIEKGMVTIIK